MFLQKNATSITKLHLFVQKMLLFQILLFISSSIQKLFPRWKKHSLQKKTPANKPENEHIEPNSTLFFL